MFVGVRVGGGGEGVKQCVVQGSNQGFRLLSLRRLADIDTRTSFWLGAMHLLWLKSDLAADQRVLRAAISIVVGVREKDAAKMTTSCDDQI